MNKFKSIPTPGFHDLADRFPFIVVRVADSDSASDETVAFCLDEEMAKRIAVGLNLDELAEKVMSDATFKDLEESLRQAVTLSEV